MGPKCIICEEKKAEFCVKGVSKYCYCRDCAQEQFSDLSLLEKMQQ
jgi:hypothetical protein